MDGSSLTLLLFVAVLIAFGAYLRWRYGSLYKKLSDLFERTTGLTMATIVQVLGILTVVIWAAIFLTRGGDRTEGLDELFQDYLPHPSQQADEP